MRNFKEFKETVEKLIAKREEQLSRKKVYDASGYFIPKSDFREDLDRFKKINETALSDELDIDYLIDDEETAVVAADKFNSAVLAAWLGFHFGDCTCQIEAGDYVILFETKTEPESSYFTDSAFLHVGSEVYLRHKSDKTFGIVVKNWEDERKGRYGSEVYNTPIWKTIDKYVYQLSYSVEDSCYGNVKISIL